MKLKEIIPSAILAGSFTLSPFLNLPAEAKLTEGVKIFQNQKEPTLKEDLRRYGNKAKKTGGRFINNIKERFQDRNSWEAKKCELTKSTTQRCKDLRSKTKN